MPAEFVYLRANYTFQRAEAATEFSMYATTIQDLSADDMSKGDRLEWYRYLHTHHTFCGQPITEVFFSDRQLGRGRTGDLNERRGGRKLYLCWN